MNKTTEITMPNRVLRDWTNSDRVNQLSVHAERFFARLIMKADDFGRYYADPKRLRSFLFPLKDNIRDADISRWIAECEKARLIRCYDESPHPAGEPVSPPAAGKRFLEIGDFRQRLRQMKAIHPIPPWHMDDRHLTVNGQSDDRHKIVKRPQPSVSDSVSSSDSEIGGMQGGKEDCPETPEVCPATENTPKFALARSILEHLNTVAKRSYRPVEANLAPIRARLVEVDEDVEGVKAMIDRQVALWDGSEMAEYLRPETLFRKSKFHGYYDQRTQPTNHKTDPNESRRVRELLGVRIQ